VLLHAGFDYLHRNAYFFLGEAFTIRALVATVIVVTGSTLAVIFGAHEDQGTASVSLLHLEVVRLITVVPSDYTLDDFLTYFDTNFMYYAVVVCGSSPLMLLLSNLTCQCGLMHQLLLLLLALGIAVALLQRRKTTSDFNRRRSFSQGAHLCACVLI